MPACDGAGTAERSYPTSEVGGAAERRYPASEVRGGNKRSYPVSEVRAAAERRYPTLLSLRPGAAGRSSYPMPPHPRPGAAAGRSNPKPEARGGGRGDQPHAVAAWAQEGLEELSYIEGRVAVRRYPSSKVRSIGCTLLEQP